MYNITYKCNVCGGKPCNYIVYYEEEDDIEEHLEGCPYTGAAKWNIIKINYIGNIDVTI